MIEFGLREFQLHMLATMPSSWRVTKALEELRATPDKARAALDYAQDVGLFRLGHSIELELAILGEPIGELPQPWSGEPFPEGFAGSKAFAFQLPVFTGYHYVVNVTPGGVVWGQRMTRPIGRSAPNIETYEDLQPWRYVKDEVLAALRQHEWIDGFSFNETYSGVMEERARSRSIEVRFDFELLQDARDVAPAVC